jgi:hypothetical protein
VLFAIEHGEQHGQVVDRLGDTDARLGPGMAQPVTGRAQRPAAAGGSDDRVNGRAVPVLGGQPAAGQTAPPPGLAKPGWITPVDPATPGELGFPVQIHRRSGSFR